MALESIMTVKKKCDESLEGRFCADGRKLCGTMEKDESASLAIGMDSVFITTSIKATKT